MQTVLLLKPVYGLDITIMPTLTETVSVMRE